jgi:putative peptide zinc metalloprotease protein
MAQVFSESWYRVAGLRPRLRGHARIYRHLYRGKPWYVLEDVAGQGILRFTPATHAVLGMMDGRRTVHELWEITTESLGDDAPTQDEMIQLLAQLHHADVLQCDVPPDAEELLERYQTRERQQWKQRLLSPFAIKIPLFDPDRFLCRILPAVRPFTGTLGGVIWLAVVLPALFLVPAQWDELTKGVLDKILAPQNLVLIYFLFPVIKALHELGHGIATRVYGGEVHDMGVMLLVLTPVPYVDASSASAFPQKIRRAQVAGAGMVVEIFLAAVAFYVWLAVEPGVVRTLAYNAMLIGSVTTLTFNANPLLRFDGYYILADLIEIPNLRQRSNAYLKYLMERYALGLRDAEEPDATPGEKRWLTAFAVAAFVYRIVIVFFIVMFVLSLSLLLGVVLGIVTVVGWVAGPVANGVRLVFTSPRTRPVRRRAIAVAGGSVGALLLLTFVLPLPYRTRTEGVVWIPDEGIVRPGTDGFVERIVATQGSEVRAGDVLMEIRDADLAAAVSVLRARLAGLEARRQKARLEEPVKVAMVEEGIRVVQRQLARGHERQAELKVRARTDGTFVVPRADDLPGRYLKKGEIVGYVVTLDTVRVRTVVPEEDIALVRDRLAAVEVRRAERFDDVVRARVSRMAPAANALLPTPALGVAGGGRVAIDPKDPKGVTTLHPVFDVELALEEPSPAQIVGGRVYLRFDHGLESLASRWARSLRQLFLSSLDV